MIKLKTKSLERLIERLVERLFFVMVIKESFLKHGNEMERDEDFSEVLDRLENLLVLGSSHLNSLFNLKKREPEQNTVLLVSHPPNFSVCELIDIQNMIDSDIFNTGVDDLSKQREKGKQFVFFNLGLEEEHYFRLFSIEPVTIESKQEIKEIINLCSLVDDIVEEFSPKE